MKPKKLQSRKRSGQQREERTYSKLQIQELRMRIKGMRWTGPAYLTIIVTFCLGLLSVYSQHTRALTEIAKQQLELDRARFAREQHDAQELLNAYHGFQLAVVEMDKKTSARVAELKAQFAQKVQSYERTITNLQAELSNVRVELAKAKSENNNLRAELAKAKQPSNNNPQTVALVQAH